jgi:molecular chaperone GrpE
MDQNQQVQEEELKEQEQAETQEQAEAVETSAEEQELAEPAGEAKDNAEEAEAGESVPEDMDPEKEALKKEAEEYYQRYLRTQADFDNFRRRARQEREEFAKYASQSLIEGLLPILDNFERAIQSSREQQKDFDALAKGVEMIARQLLQLLEGEGLKEIEALGQPFNPELHQAVMTVEAEEGTESGTVVEVLQKGYMLKERVIRPSMVKVAQ